MVMGVAETGVGLGLLALPSLVASLLLGATLDTATATTVARVAGVALVTLGVACWLARNDTQSRAARGLICAMLVYNAGVCVVLVYAALGTGISTLALWAVAVAHAGMAAGCLAALSR